MTEQSARPMSRSYELIEARTEYWTWSGLRNRRARDAITFIAGVWLARRKGRWAWFRRAQSWIYCTSRAVLAAFRQTFAEMSQARRRTITEFGLTIPLLLVPIPPYREFLNEIPFAWWGLAGAAVAVASLRLITRVVSHRSEVAEDTTTVLRLNASIYHLVRIVVSTRVRGERVVAEHYRRAVELILQHIADISRTVLRIPESVKLQANLMVPMRVVVTGQPEDVHGCGIVAYGADKPSQPNWSRIPAGDIGAGQVLKTGQVEVIEDTRDPIWHGVLENLRPRSFVSLPLLSPSEAIVGVVNIDSPDAATFTRKRVDRDLYPALEAPLRMLTDMLLVNQGDAEAFARMVAAGTEADPALAGNEGDS